MAYLTHRELGVPITASAIGIFDITPDDNADLPQRTRAILAAEEGMVSVVMMNGSTGTFFLAAGILFPAMVVRIKATGTNASGLVGFY